MTTGSPAGFDYREMARECVREATETSDINRKKTLIGMARMYNQTAIHLIKLLKVVAPNRTASEHTKFLRARPHTMLRACCAKRMRFVADYLGKKFAAHFATAQRS